MFRKSDDNWIWENQIYLDHFKTPLRIAFDFDGVFTSPHFQKKNAFKSLGYPVTVEETSRSFWIEKFPSNMDIYHRVTKDVNVNNLMYVPLVNGCRNAIQELLSNKKISLIIITYRTRKETFSLLKYLDINNISITTVIPTMNQFKGDFLELIFPVIFVDDNILTLEKLDEKRIQFKFMENCELLCFMHEANINTSILSKSIRKVSTWVEITEFVKEKCG